jgi:hypothetical protein
MGAVMVMFSNAMSSMLSTQTMVKNERLRFENMQIGRAMIDFAERNEGELPAQEEGNDASEAGFALPYTTASRPENYPSITAGTIEDRFLSAIQQRGITLEDAREASGRGRFYVMEEKIIDTPLSGISGGTVQLSLQEGVVYTDNETMEAAADITGFEYLKDNPEVIRKVLGYRFSNRNIQLAKLRTTDNRIERLMSAIADVVSLERLSADPAAATSENFYPGASDGLTGSIPSTTIDHCTHGWIDLSDLTPGSDGELVMQSIGLTQQEFGQTAWEKPIYYCYDYDPGGTASAPYFGAIAFDTDMKGGGTSSYTILTP